MDTLTAIRKQRAVREYAQQGVTDEQIETILNAARLSGSSKNSQPWQFIIVRNEDTRIALSKCGRFAAYLPAAPVVIVVVMPSDSYWAGFDAGRAAQNMMLAATDLGLGTCIATMHDHACAHRVLGVPDNLDCQLTIALGVPKSSQATVSEPEVRRPSPARVDRKPLDEFLHYDRWGQRSASA